MLLNALFDAEMLLNTLLKQMSLRNVLLKQKKFTEHNSEAKIDSN